MIIGILIWGENIEEKKMLLSQTWTARRSNQSILKEISPDWLGRLMLKLKLQSLGHLVRRTDTLERPWRWKRLKAGGEGDDRGWDCWMASPTRWTWVWASSGSWWWTGKPSMLQSMGSQRVRHDWSELNCTERMVLEKTLESSLCCKEIKPVSLKGN